METELKKQLEGEVERGGRAYIRNIIAAEQAILQGRFNVAKVLRAVAHSQRVMAMDAARLLDKNQDDEDLLGAILEELAITIDVSDSIENEVKRRIERSHKIRKSLGDIVRRSVASLQSNSDILESDVAQHLWGCFGCGTIMEGTPPHACPNCGALSVEFDWFGPFYSTTTEHIGQLSPDDIIQILQSIPDEVDTLITKVDDSVLRHKPSPDEWCIAEIVGHILETDRLFALRAQALLEEQGTELPRPMPPWKLHEGKGYETMSPSELMTHMRDTRQQSLDLIRTMTPEDWIRRGHIQGATTSMLDLGTWLANHDRGHLAQIRQLCEA